MARRTSKRSEPPKGLSCMTRAMTLKYETTTPHDSNDLPMLTLYIQCLSIAADEHTKPLWLRPWLSNWRSRSCQRIKTAEQTEQQCLSPAIYC